MNDGIYPGLSWEDYCSIDALNGSSIIHMRKSPMYYRYMRDNPQPPTDAMILGTATHRLVLEPEKVGDFAVWGEREEEKVRRGQVWEAFKAAHTGKMIVTVAERDLMVGMAVGARRNAPIMRYASAKGETEVSMVWTDKTSGRRFKGRLDKIIEKDHIIFDLNTCRACNKFKFGAQTHQLGYHIKMGLYWSGYKNLTGHAPKCVLGAIESKEPFESAVYRCTSDVILQGLEDFDGLLHTLTQCELSGEWPAAEPEELELTMPSYAYTQPEDDLSDLALVEE